MIRMVCRGTAKVDLVLEKIISALETAGRLQTGDSPQEIAGLVQKVGTNRLMTSKKLPSAFPNTTSFPRRYLGK
jgi:hypothetical protein